MVSNTVKPTPPSNDPIKDDSEIDEEELLIKAQAEAAEAERLLKEAEEEAARWEKELADIEAQALAAEEEALAAALAAEEGRSTKVS